MKGHSRHKYSLIGRKNRAKFEMTAFQGMGIESILLHQFNDLGVILFCGNTLYGDVKILTTFCSQCTENPPFRFLWDTRYSGHTVVILMVIPGFWGSRSPFGINYLYIKCNRARVAAFFSKWLPSNQFSPYLSLQWTYSCDLMAIPRFWGQGSTGIIIYIKCNRARVPAILYFKMTANQLILDHRAISAHAVETYGLAGYMPLIYSIVGTTI